MARISVDLKYFKVLFPTAWFGGLVLFALNFIYIGTLSGSAEELFGLSLLTVIGYMVMKAYLFDLIGEVYDCGDKLLIRNRGIEDYVAISNIESVSFNNTNPPRITLQLTSPSVFGSKIAFSPKSKFALNPFAPNPVAKSLQERIDRGRIPNVV